jgi:hypothetical protein
MVKKTMASITRIAKNRQAPSMVEIVRGGVVGRCFFAISIVSIGDFGSKRVAETLIKKDEKRNIYRKICLDEKGIIIGAILINQVDDLGVIHGLIREKKGADFLKLNSVWKSPMSYGLVYKNILQGKL